MAGKTGDGKSVKTLVNKNYKRPFSTDDNVSRWR